MRIEKGFTLIELIVVIVVLTLLAVTALPRFINLTDQSYQAQIDGISAQFGSAVSFSQKQWIVNGATPASQVNLDGYGGGSLDVNDVGFPIGTNKGNNQGEMSNPYQIGKNDQGCVSIWEAIVEGDFSVSTDAANYTNHDFIAKRVFMTFTPEDSPQVRQRAICYYALTEKGYNVQNPHDSMFVIWYNSRSGIVSTEKPADAEI